MRKHRKHSNFVIFNRFVVWVKDVTYLFAVAPSRLRTRRYRRGLAFVKGPRMQLPSYSGRFQCLVLRQNQKLDAAKVAKFLSSLNPPIYRKRMKYPLNFPRLLWLHFWCGLSVCKFTDLIIIYHGFRLHEASIGGVNVYNKC